jgi:predicted DCC family thiol-disulfide oxidoreductase YuxK
MTELPEPQIRALTVLYDADCPLCRAARAWLGRQDKYLPMIFVAAGSAQARKRFAGLDHEATLREITVVADTGAVYAGDAAWLMCLWALSRHRALAIRLAQPGLRPLARRVVAAASAVRSGLKGNGTVLSCDDACTRR